MINIIDKSSCCGCGACTQRCPKQCISMHEDSEGFLYPIVDKAKCINCDLCEKICPFLNQSDNRVPIKTLAAINNDYATRLQSSSGGLFTYLAEKIIDEGGVVFGAKFNDKWNVIIDFTTTKEGLSALRGSKYVQATVGDTFKQCEAFLKDGRKVLYSGTPCQISGLKHFLRRNYDNLILLDVACHGVPSPKVWRMYLQEVTDAINIKHISFRAKPNGWRLFNFDMKYDVDTGSILLSTQASDNPYMKAFLSDLILRPSCYACKVKECRSNSDITLADYWGIWNVVPNFNDDKGTSLVLLHNHKLDNYLTSSQLHQCETTYHQATAYNSALLRSSASHPKRDYFFSQLDSTKDLQTLIKSTTRPTGLALVKMFVRESLNSVCHMPRIARAFKCKWGGGNAL